MRIGILSTVPETRLRGRRGVLLLCLAVGVGGSVLGGLYTRGAIGRAPSAASRAAAGAVGDADPVGEPDDVDLDLVCRALSDTQAGVTFQCSLDGAPFTACTSPQAYSGLAIGAHHFQAKAVAGAQMSPASPNYNWTITAPPAPPAPSVSPDAVGRASPTNQTSISFARSDTQAGVTYLCSFDNSAYAACTSPKSYPGPLADGSHTFAAEAQAGSGTSAATTHTWTIDTTPPTVSVSFPASGGLYDAAAWNAGCAGGAGICGGATDPSGVASGTVSILQVATGKYWDGTSFGSSSEVFNAATATGGTGTTYTGRYPLALPADGAYTVHARATDNLGNTTPPAQQVVVNFTIDTTPPPPPSITSNPPAFTSSTSASFSFNDTEAGATFVCKLDGAAYAACTSPKSYTGLANGSHTFSVEAVDAAGNTSSATSFSWAVGPPPAPTITAFPANPTNQTSAAFSFSDADLESTFLCKLDGAAYAACTSPQSYAGPLAAGSHTFSVEAKDGSSTGPAASYTWTIDLTPPVAPTITAKPANPTNQTSASFSFTDEAGATFLCKLDAGSFAACASPQSYPGPIGAGSHSFSAEAKDVAGNTGPAASYTWTVDLTPPPAPLDHGESAEPSRPSASASFSFTETTPRPGRRFCARSTSACSRPVRARRPSRASPTVRTPSTSRRSTRPGTRARRPRTRGRSTRRRPRRRRSARAPRTRPTRPLRASRSATPTAPRPSCARSTARPSPCARRRRATPARWPPGATRSRSRRRTRPATSARRPRSAGRST